MDSAIRHWTDDDLDEAYQKGVRSGALAQEKKNREELTKTIKFLHDEVYEQGKREGAEEARKKPRYKTQFNDVPFVPSCDCSSWDDCRSEAYKEGRDDAIDEWNEYWEMQNHKAYEQGRKDAIDEIITILAQKEDTILSDKQYYALSILKEQTE